MASSVSSALTVLGDQEITLNETNFSLKLIPSTRLTGIAIAILTVNCNTPQQQAPPQEPNYKLVPGWKIRPGFENLNVIVNKSAGSELKRLIMAESVPTRQGFNLTIIDLRTGNREGYVPKHSSNNDYGARPIADVPNFLGST